MIKTMTIPKTQVGGQSFAPARTISVMRGFAQGPAGSFFKSNHPIMVEIEGLRLLNPSQIEDLLHSRRCLEEVKMLIEEEADPTYICRGNIRIENSYYRLVNVDLSRQESGRTLKADLADPLDRDEGLLYTDAEDDFIGQIEVKEVGGTANGRLFLSRGIYSGRYAVRLEDSWEARY